MHVLKIIEYLRKNVLMLKRAFFTYLIILIIMDIFLPREDAHYFIDKLYAFWSLFALLGCFLLIKISKGIAHMFLAKDEDFYG